LNDGAEFHQSPFITLSSDLVASQIETSKNRSFSSSSRADVLPNVLKCVE